MSNDSQTNLGYFMIIMIDYDSFSHCHLAEIFFAIHAGARGRGSSYAARHLYFVAKDKKGPFIPPFL